MILTILGSGTCVPSLQRSSCALLAETGAAKILLDCGPGTMRRLLEAGTTIFDITHIFLSHFHPDHSGELASFLFANKYSWPPPKRKTALTLSGGSGFQQFYENLKNLYGEWVDFQEVPLIIREFSRQQADTADFSDFSMTTRPVSHQPESLAYKISADGVSVVYSGDTDVDDNLVALARGSDILVCESAFPDDSKVTGHLTPSLAGKMAEEAGVPRLVLTHFYPPCDTVDIKSQCQAVYSGEIVLAQDLLQLTL